MSHLAIAERRRPAHHGPVQRRRAALTASPCPAGVAHDRRCCLALHPRFPPSRFQGRRVL